MNEVAVEEKKPMPLSELKERLGKIDFSIEAVNQQFQAIENADDTELDVLSNKYDEWREVMWRAEDIINAFKTQIRVKRDRNDMMK